MGCGARGLIVIGSFLACLGGGMAVAQDKPADNMEIGHYDRLIKFIDTFAKAYNAMTDETATKLLAEYLALESNHAALLKSYLPRFQKVLPARKVARLYQVENKVRALVNYELAREIPFIK